MSQIRSVRKDNIKFDMNYPDSTPEIFVDGVDHTLQGYPISKVVFYQTTQMPKESGEVVQRQAALRLVISTASLLEFCRNTIRSYSTDKGNFEINSKRHIDRIAKVYDEVTIKEKISIGKNNENNMEKTTKKSTKKTTV